MAPLLHRAAVIKFITDFSWRSEVVDEILERHDDLGEADVFPETTVSSVSTQRLQRSERDYANERYCMTT